MILTGRSVALVAAGALATVLTRNPWVVALWGAAILAAAVLDWLLLPRRFTVDRSRTPSVRLSQTHEHTYRLTNTSERRIRGMVRDSWQPSAGATRNVHSLSLAPGESVTLTTVLVPRRRGHLRGHSLTLRARSLLGLVWRQTTIPAAAVLRVLPEFKSRRHLPSRLARLRDIDGQSSLLVRGEGTEFDSLRDYVDGDDVRSLDWRASARRQQLVVRTWRPERDRRVLIVLDTSRLAAARLENETRLDAGIETALLMAALGNHAGDQVDAVAADRRVRARVSESRGAATMSAFADAFGPLEPELTEADWPLITRTVTSQLSSRALVILCTAVDPSSLTSGLITAAHALAVRHQVLIASATDPVEGELRRRRESSEDVFIAAAAARAESDRMGVSELLSSGGVQVIQAEPDDLAPRVADRYLELKATGRL